MYLADKRVNKLSDLERGYIAGVIEGDGSICLDTKNRSKQKTSKSHPVDISPNVYVHNTSLPLLENIKNIIGRGSVYHIKKRDKPSGGVIHRKPVHRYRLGSLQDVKFLLEQIVDLFVTYKKRQAELVIEYCTLRIKRLQKSKRGDKCPYGAIEWSIVEDYNSTRQYKKVKNGFENIRCIR